MCLPLWLENTMKALLLQLPWIHLYKNALQCNISATPISPSPYPFIQSGLELFCTLPFFLNTSPSFFRPFFPSPPLPLFFLLVSFFFAPSPISDDILPLFLGLSLIYSLASQHLCLSVFLSSHPSHYFPLTFSSLYLSSSSLVIGLYALSSFWFLSSFLPLSALHLQVSGSWIEDVLNTFIICLLNLNVRLANNSCSYFWLPF